MPEQSVQVISNGHEQMRVSCDLGLQNLGNRDSSSTATTHTSFGVAVPVKLPASSSPNKVYYSRRA